MKKNNKLLILAIFLSFVFVGKVDALEKMKVNVPYKAVSTIDFSGYRNVECDISGFNESNEYIEAIYLDGGYQLKWRNHFGKVPSDMRSWLACSFEQKLGVPNQPEEKEISVTVEYGRYLYAVTVRKPLIKGDVESIDLINSVDVKYFSDLSEITSVAQLVDEKDNKYEGGNKFVDIDCPLNQKSKCVISLKSTLPIDTNFRYAGYKIEYKTNDGYEGKVTIELKLSSQSYVYAYPGDYGVCSFDDKWKKDADNAYSQVVTGTSINLPTCTADNSANPLLEFKGWVPLNSDEYNERPDEMSSDVCVDYVTTTGGSIEFHGENDVFMSCYSTSSGIILIPNGGTIKEQAGYIKKDDVVYVKGTGNITLPEPTGIPSLYNMYDSARFEGWMDVEGNIYKAGDSVPADGKRYMALYSTGQTFDGVDVNQKIIYVGTPANYVLSSTKIESCESTDTKKVTTSMSGGECILHGKESTGYEYIDVVVKTTGGQRIVKVRVVDANGSLTLGPIEFEASYLDDDQDGEYISNGESGSELCNSYYVSDVKKMGDFAKFNGYTLNVREYGATPKCGGERTLALCMDPGRYGPIGGANYIIDNSFDGSSDFEALISHIVQQFVKSGQTDADKTAADVALRIVQYYDSELLADNNPLRSAVAAYSTAGKKLKKDCPDISECNKNKIKASLDSSWDWSNTTILDKVAGYLSGFEKNTASNNEVKNESTRTSYYDPDNEFLYHIEYKGKLTFPDGAKVSESDIKAHCGTVPGVSGCKVAGEFKSSTVYEYTFSYVVDLRNPDCEIPGIKGNYDPDNDSDKHPKIIITVGGGVTASNVFVIKSVSNSLQRMVVFDTKEVILNVQMPIYVNCDLEKAPFDSNNDNFRYDLFKEAGCCQLVTDETSKIFQDYCTADCVQSTFVTTCDPNEENDVDVYTISEGYKIDGKTRKLNYACVVDVQQYSGASSLSIENTNELKDAAGNKYALASYEGNQYCSVSCKEDWDISTSSFRNFTGGNAVAAGSYFIINDPIFIGGKRTCVTTYVDYNKYIDDLTTLSNEIKALWNQLSEVSKAYTALNASKTSEERTYYTYTSTGKSDCGCKEDPVTKELKCTDCWVRTAKKCTVNKIELGSGLSYKTSVGGSGTVDISKFNGSTFTTSFESNYTEELTAKSISNGYCGEESHEDLMASIKYNGNSLSSVIDSLKAQITNRRDNLQNKAIDMTRCQNFRLKNVSAKSANKFNYDGSGSSVEAYGGNDTISGLVSEKVQTIETKFEPSAMYEYDEKAYMNIIGKNNVIEVDMETNKAFINEEGKNFESFANDCVKTGRTKDVGSNRDVMLCKNKLTTKAYQESAAWEKGTDVARTYGYIGGNEVVALTLSSFDIVICAGYGDSLGYDDIGSCSSKKVNYYPVNYFKQTLENGSFYKNKNNWYIDNSNSNLQHAATKDIAVQKLGVNENFVSTLGQNNTFPVGITTPRNMYKYTYQFSNIGYYSDGTPGRIMGDSATSLVPINKHACFYEVYEDICICCGDPITWTVYTSGEFEDTEKYLKDNNYDYNMSSTKYDNLSSQYGFINSTVSPYNLDGNNDGTLSSNWSSNDQFTYLTSVYTTDKGEGLAGAIVERGESIYDKYPEYSYTINPAAMSLIREYNTGHTYGYNVDRLIPYGTINKQTPFDSKLKASDFDPNKHNTFSHFGSEFLEKFMKSYVTEEYKNKVLINRKEICSVTINNGDIKNSKKAAEKAFNLVQSGNKCRWVDYVEKTPDGKEIRLAFK